MNQTKNLSGNLTHFRNRYRFESVGANNPRILLLHHLFRPWLLGDFGHICLSFQATFQCSGKLKASSEKLSLYGNLKACFFSFLNLEKRLKVSINFTEEKARAAFKKSCKSCSSNKQSVTRAVAQINRVVDRTSLAALFRFKIQTSKSVTLNIVAPTWRSK